MDERRNRCGKGNHPHDKTTPLSLNQRIDCQGAREQFLFPNGTYCYMTSAPPKHHCHTSIRAVAATLLPGRNRCQANIYHNISTVPVQHKERGRTLLLSVPRKSCGVGIAHRWRCMTVDELVSGDTLPWCRAWSPGGTSERSAVTASLCHAWWAASPQHVRPNLHRNEQISNLRLPPLRVAVNGFKTDF